MKLSIIIISFNTKDFLNKCLTSVFENISKKISFEVIVVDNDSRDDSVEMVKKEFPKVILIQNKKNLGFAKANNVGIKRTKGDYVLFLNSDTVVPKETMEYMLDFMDKNQKVGASTCKVLMVNGQIDDASHRGFPTPWNALCHFSGLSKLFPKSKLFSGYSLGYMDLNTTHKIDALAGAFMLTRREAGKDAGWWDEDYFFYGEDLDFCYQLQKRGWDVYYVPDVSILHYKGVSGGIKKISSEITTADDKTRKLANNARFDAMRIFYRKNYENKYPKVFTKLVMFGISLKQRIR
jgi:GT2 family glycosyltransferase